MSTAYKFTWEKKCNRWRKVYKGRVWTGKRGVNKSDTEAYRQALSDFEIWRGKIDLDSDNNKPHRKDYEKAIRKRQAIIDWCFNEGLENLSPEDKTFYDLTVVQIEKLRADFSRFNPPNIEPFDIDPISKDNVGSYANAITWGERLDALKTHHKWTKTKDPENTVGGNVDAFLSSKKTDAKMGAIEVGSYDILVHRLNYLRSFCGNISIKTLTAKILVSFVSYLKNIILEKEISPSYGEGIMTTTKSFVRWLWKNEILDNLPRNIDDLHITAEAEEIVPLTKDQITTLLNGATGKTRLYLLLMLNCGYTQKDISDLKHKEIDWQEGRIYRKRSKTKKKQNVPKVNYKLWDTTCDLLKAYRSEHPTLALINENGEPLRQRYFDEVTGKTKSTDNIKKAYERLCTKLKLDTLPLKLIRKTAASKLEEHDVYGRYGQYFLGQSPKSVADIHYIRPSDELFDRALKWLGEQFDIK